MINLSERYRLKALACEQFSQDSADPVIKTALTEIAIEWHALSSRIARHNDKDHELELE